jgi:anti-anti-sigma factor
MEIEVLGYTGPVLRIAIIGRIVRSNHAPMIQSFESILGPEGYRQPVVVNMERTTFIDSSGVAFLIQCHKRFLQAGGRLIFHSVTPAVRDLFQTMGLLQVFCLAESESQALSLAEAVQPASPPTCSANEGP